MNYGNYPDLRHVKRILVIKLRHIGDVLLTSPLFSCLKEALPEAEIDAFIYKECAPMLEGHPALSQLILYDRDWKKKSLLRKFLKEWQLLQLIRSRGYDLVINLTEGDRGAIVAWVSGASIRAGIDPKGKGFLGKSKIYTHLIKQCSTPRHTVEKNLDALRRIGIFPEPEKRDLFFHIPDPAMLRMRHLLEGAGVEEGQYLLIHPASRWKFKCLPTITIARLIDALKEQGMSIVLTSGPDQEELAMASEIVKKSNTSIVNFAGQTSLKELAALIKMSRGLICVDSVALHIASALKTPVVTIFGPTSEQNWGPWMHPESRVVTQSISCRPCFMDGCGGSKKSDCLYSLSVEQILKTAEQLFITDHVFVK